jgi:hypothetical protein
MAAIFILKIPKDLAVAEEEEAVAAVEKLVALIIPQ